MATELATIEKCAVDALLAAWARFADHTPFDGQGHAAFARALQSMSWKVEDYTRQAPHSALGMRPPTEYRASLELTPPSV